jgi:hypothetical protein
MFLLDSSFVTWLNRPYFDLGMFNDGALHVKGIGFKYKNLVENSSKVTNNPTINPIILNHASSFRESLIRESR